MMSVETMRSVNPKTVDRSTLVQRDSIRLEPAAAQDDRLRDFIRQIRNPYCYLDGKWSVIIKVKSPNARKGDKIITLRRDSKWENGIQARNAGRR